MRHKVDNEMESILPKITARPCPYIGIVKVLDGETRWYTEQSEYFFITKVLLSSVIRRNQPKREGFSIAEEEFPCPKEVDMADSWIPTQPRKGSRWNRCR
jgi:hypothetical protein